MILFFCFILFSIAAKTKKVDYIYINTGKNSDKVEIFHRINGCMPGKQGSAVTMKYENPDNVVKLYGYSTADCSGEKFPLQVSGSFTYLSEASQFPKHSGYYINGMQPKCSLYKEAGEVGLFVDGHCISIESGKKYCKFEHDTKNDKLVQHIYSDSNCQVKTDSISVDCGGYCWDNNQMLMCHSFDPHYPLAAPATFIIMMVLLIFLLF